MKWYGISLLHPDPAQICPLELARALAGIHRWQGRAGSVLAHSMRVALQVPARMRAHALLHDAHEAYMGDPSGPLCDLIPEIGQVARLLDRAIYRSAGLDEPDAETRATILTSDRNDRGLELATLQDGYVLRERSAREWLEALALHIPIRSPWLPIIFDAH